MKVFITDYNPINKLYIASC